ncbi:DUF805 domain-containing protein [Pseudomonas sp. ADAK2]|uniref:DUF805 domain-containing protein n=1 Tax=unclassified Pseudomonas TaxID=196821 RepID=UPI0014635BF4|nr:MULTISPECIES: DUF805 domain-containing protein [unclassified Pseudomonas]QJI41214.1 DUF805 domain-containing protein [Pseudomonas sp. ADAK7]QJI47518.1 DUF805 domain-containing protein [Pseudomonas sp. ADAK2]
MSCWIRLGIEPTKDQALIRDAYRARLPQHHPESDPEGFQALREAYESANRFARQEEEDVEEEDAGVPEMPQTIVDFYALLEDPTRRFNPQAWQVFVKALDQLPLDALDDLSWGLFHPLANARPLSYRCANLLAQRLAWEQQLLDLEFDQAKEVEAFLQRIKGPDPFDTTLMGDWPEPAQLETLWYARSLDYIFQHRPLHEFADFASHHTCLPLPADDAFIQRLLVQFTQAGIGGPGLRQVCVEQQAQAPDDVDWLYLLACQNSLLGLEDQALPCWIRLWQEHRHPKAESRLLELCARRQPDFLALLIQAFDRLENFRDWSTDLADVSQTYGSPSQRPETLARWLGVGQLELQGLAAAFVDWRMTGDELPLLALLIGQPVDARLQQLYRHAWALHRGDVGLLQHILDEPQPVDALEGLVLSGFKYQAAQQLCWLNQASIPLALKAFLGSRSAEPQLAEELAKDEPHTICRLWLRRLRPYDQSALARIDRAFDLQDAQADVDLRGVSLLVQLEQRGVVLPAMAQGEAAWQWHAQTLFLLALLDQPERWLSLIDSSCLERLEVDPTHPLSRLQPLLRRLQREQGSCAGLLGWLQASDPVHGLLVQKLFNVQQALDSAALPGNAQLYTCIESDPDACGEDVLGLMLLWGVLYHDPTLNAEQHRALLQSIAAISCEDEWFEGFRNGLIKGEPVWPPEKVLADFGVEKLVVYSLLDTLKSLVRHGAAGVPRNKVLTILQYGKDNTENSVGLRLALTALLSWNERLLLASSDKRPVPAMAFWRLGSRLGRKAFIGQVLGCVLFTPYLALMSGTALSGIGVLLLGALLLLGAILRRLHDMGRGIPTLLIFGCLSPVLPFMPLLLFGFPGDKLPNRYGAPPDSGGEDTLSGGLQAALRRLNG